MELYDWIQRSDFDRAKSTVAFIEDCIHQYGLQHMALSFNGGKDCTALLHLTRAALAHLHLPLTDLLVLYFDEPDPFPEMQQFLHHTIQQHRLNTRILTGTYHTALTQFFSPPPTTTPTTPPTPRITAILLGQRRADPHSHSLSLVTPSSEGWPAFLRVNPLLEWSYGEVWRLLRSGQAEDDSVQWCVLYERGYTSVGARGTSGVTKGLWDGERGVWRGAWELVEEADERGGRDVEEVKGNGVVGGEVGGGGGEREVASSGVPVFHDGDSLHRLQSVPIVNDSAASQSMLSNSAAATEKG